jgi:ferrous iron transport protein A
MTHINLNEMNSHLELAMSMLLSQLPNGTHALVERVESTSMEVGESTVRRLGELGFIPGEPVQMLRRGPGGREPLAVQVGETQFALRLIEAQCIHVQTDLTAKV